MEQWGFCSIDTEPWFELLVSVVHFHKKVFLQILQITLLIADYMNMIGKTTMAAGSSESGASSLFLSTPSSVMQTPKLGSKVLE